MASSVEKPDIDTLASLEQRISRAVELVGSLRQENKDFSALLETAEAERDAARKESAVVHQNTEALTREIEELRNERKQVRQRIEKLLGQMDLFSAT